MPSHTCISLKVLTRSGNRGVKELTLLENSFGEENNFGNWTSGNNEIDKLIQECQQTVATPDYIIEWISYDQFENVKYLQILERFGRHEIVLKRLNNSNSNNTHWFQEVTLSFTLDNTSQYLVKCYGLTKNPTNQDYILVLNYHHNDLRHFLKDNYQSLTLLQKYHIIDHIAYDRTTTWCISDLGVSGSVNKQLDGIYGNFPFASELLCNRNYTTKSDVYDLGIIMWETITGETPFSNHQFNSNSDFALAIISGYRPKIYESIPYEYATLMKQCWDANPNSRPDNYEKNTIINSQSIAFNISAQPRNATEEQLAYETKQFDFEIPEEFEQLSLNDVDNSNDSNDSQVDQEYGVAGPLNSGSHFRD
ncbi:hypothetical protein Glove_220g44 [Diversispora epigaea]|uniref:Protein kinase domain-containing protein n=1 Tax=Diversispora epigaea TaxID=1348612 RepID=A0A397IFB5_9GLOM|nr:hypothetical protein Glove_220g44 [Diversispora epigaea]